MPTKPFISDSKDSVDNFMTRCSVCYEWFHKKCKSICKKVISSEDNIKNLNVITTNCNVYNETLHFRL